MARPSARTFRFRRRNLPCEAEQTLAATLSAHGVRILGRSIRYHRPRAPFCGVGYCTQCLVRVNGVPNIRSCTYAPAPGDAVGTENGWPSVDRDLLGAIDWLFPHGIDTLRGFRRPAAFRGLYHRVIRSLAGYGRPPTPPARPEPRAGERIDTELLVVGAGPAGRAAAARLASAGHQVLLVDRGPLLAPPPQARARAGTTVTFLPAPDPGRSPRFVATGLGADGTPVLLRAQTVCVAAGAYDGGLLVPGVDRPGVLTASGALSLAGPQGEPPFTQAIVFGGGARAGELLDRFGTHVAAAVSPGAFAPEVAARAAELEIPLYPRSLLVEVRGRRGVAAVRIQGRGGGPEQLLPVDAVLLAHCRFPNGQLFFQAGAQMDWRGSLGAYTPVLGPGFETSVPGLFAVGEAAGFEPGSPAEASGIAAAEQLLEGTTPSVLPARAEPGRPSEMAGYYTELLRRRAGRGKWILCACEDVLLQELEEASRAGYRGLEEIKRYTGVGTGLCQGRFCLPEAILLLSDLEHRPPSEVGYIRQRPPVVPTPLGTWARMPEETG